MGRAPCCSKVGLHRGPWTPREDTLLTKYIEAHGEGHWKYLPKKAGLLRCGKSCRLRWMNYLRPDIKRGNISPDEDDLIIRLHSLLGNRWSLIAGRLPGRTDNEIKNYWNTHLSKRLKSPGTSVGPNAHKKLVQEPTNKRKNCSKPNNNSNKKKQKNMQKANAETEKKHKIHLPKPIRVTSFSIPRIDSFDQSNTVSGSSSSHAGDGGFDHTEVVDVLPWSNSFKDGGANSGMLNFFVRDEEDDLVKGSDFDQCQSHISTPTDHNTLQKLYEEYLQLLKSEEEDQVQLDSFAESFLL